MPWNTRRQRDDLLAAVALAGMAVAFAALAGCSTYDAVTAAPEEFWVTAETIVWALWQDILTVVEWVL